MFTPTFFYIFTNYFLSIKILQKKYLTNEIKYDKMAGRAQVTRPSLQLYHTPHILSSGNLNKFFPIIFPKSLCKMTKFFCIILCNLSIANECCVWYTYIKVRVGSNDSDASMTWSLGVAWNLPRNLERW